MSQITHDLAIVGRLSRGSLPSLDATLARFVRPPDDALKLSQLFVARVARTAAGATSVVAVVALLCFIVGASHTSESTLDTLVFVDKPWAGGTVLFAATLAYAIAASVAARSFARHPSAARLAPLARWSSTSPVMGAMFVVGFFGLAQALLGGDALSELRQMPIDGGDIWHRDAMVLFAFAALLAIALPLFVRDLPRWTRWLGVALIAATVACGLAFDVGPASRAFAWPDVEMAVLHPSLALRAALTASGMLGVFFVARATFGRADG